MLYTEEMSDREIKDQAQVPSLKLKIYERIPIPDLPVNTSTFSINLCLFIAMLFTTDILLFFFFQIKKIKFMFSDSLCRLFFLTRSYLSVYWTRYEEVRLLLNLMNVYKFGVEALAA